ncbi:hypothetical protein QJS04_geneDACA000634 [Acorus gramineus]|uniref:Uncharacterized protein n=1 Tax=Acorus gramineus TaxID=55184 RepID=A0AAV9AUV7_ACOGR|nr:hypothetical protein QJS04_geneDACA000634 [Acorus gramineus]
MGRTCGIYQVGFRDLEKMKIPVNRFTEKESLVPLKGNLLKRWDRILYGFSVSTYVWLYEVKPMQWGVTVPPKMSLDLNVEKQFTWPLEHASAVGAGIAVSTAECLQRCHIELQVLLWTAVM